MREFKRTDRLDAELRRDIGEICRDELQDPRLGMITIQEVRVSRDLSHAKVFFTRLGGKLDPARTELLLNRHISGFVRTALGKRVRMRNLPQLLFVYDRSIEGGQQLSSLIEQAVRTDNPGSE